jgi:hypothetical protein
MLAHTLTNVVLLIALAVMCFASGLYVAGAACVFFIVCCIGVYLNALSQRKRGGYR